MELFDDIKLIEEIAELQEKGIHKNYLGTIVKMEGDIYTVSFYNPKNLGEYAFAKVNKKYLTFVFRPHEKIIAETQLDQLKKGRVDVLSSVTGGEETKAALALVDGVNFKETHYDRAGYGKLAFRCDFGPTQFAEVRRAILHTIDREEFAQTFTGGYGIGLSMAKAIAEKHNGEITAYKKDSTHIGFKVVF